MKKLSFKFLPSEFSEDHQVRALVDEEDLLELYDSKSLGLDPPEFFEQKSLTTSGNLRIGRCECGCVGCGDTYVKVLRSQDKVEWSFSSGAETIEFDRVEYDREIERAAADFSWETPDRTVERLVSNLDYSSCEKLGLRFEFASARIKNDKVILSFRSGDEQKLFDIPWTHRDHQQAVADASELILKISKSS